MDGIRKEIIPLTTHFELFDSEPFWIHSKKDTTPQNDCKSNTKKQKNDT